MRKLPPSWSWACLDQVATVDANLVDPTDYPNESHIAPNHIESGTGRLLPYHTVSEDGVTSAKHLFSRDHILYSKIRPYLAKATLAPSRGLCSADMYPIRSFIDRRYLWHWLLSGEFTSYAVSQQGRSLLPKINRLQLERLPIPVPPLAEQQRIVAAIEEEFSRIEVGANMLDRVRRAVRQLRLAVQQAAVLGRLIPQDAADEPAAALVGRVNEARCEAFQRMRRRFEQPVSFDTAGLPTLPASWTWASLDALADVVGGVTKDQQRQLYPDAVDVPYLRVANVQRGFLNLEEIATIRVPRTQAEYLRLKPGDVLFNEGGDRDKLGRGWVWEGQVEACIHQNHVFRARMYSGEIDPYLVSVHGNTFGRAWFQGTGKQTTNLASVNRTTLRSFPVPIAPLGEQRRIRAALDQWMSTLDHLRKTVDGAARRGRALRSGVLAAAFSGRLVQQNPTDEPASVLLARVLAEQAATRDQTSTAPTRRRRVRPVGPISSKASA